MRSLISSDKKSHDACKQNMFLLAREERWEVLRNNNTIFVHRRDTSDQSSRGGKKNKNRCGVDEHLCGTEGFMGKCPCFRVGMGNSQSEQIFEFD